MTAKQSHAWLSRGQHDGQIPDPSLPGYAEAGGYFGSSPTSQKPKVEKQSQLWSTVALEKCAGGTGVRPGQQALPSLPIGGGAQPPLPTHAAFGDGSPLSGWISSQPGHNVAHEDVSGSFAGGWQNPIVAKQSHAWLSVGQQLGHFFP